jgi:hypothetical protein
MVIHGSLDLKGSSLLPFFEFAAKLFVLLL